LKSSVITQVSASFILVVLAMATAETGYTLVRVSKSPCIVTRKFFHTGHILLAIRETEQRRRRDLMSAHKD